MPSIFNTKFMSWVWGRRGSALSLGSRESRGFVQGLRSSKVNICVLALRIATKDY